MLRSAASPGSVGFGRFGGGTSGLLIDAAPDRPPSLRASGSRLIHSSISQNTKGVPGAARPARRGHLILDSRNSTCFLATGSYFFFTSLSVMVREFLRVT